MFDKVKGKVKENISLKPFNWFKLDATADYLFSPSDADDLLTFLQNKPKDIPVYVLGCGSNILLSSKRIKGVIIHTKYLDNIKILDNNNIEVGVGCNNRLVANNALNHSIGGLEFLCGIPGSIGGGIAMNAGSFGSDFNHILVSTTAISLETNEVIQFFVEDLKLSYRYNPFKSNMIFINAILKGYNESPQKISEVMDNIKKERDSSQPKKVLTGGSTFANYITPNGEVIKAWELIDKVGLRGFSVGGAMFSQKHCNFIINEGTATYEDILALITEAKKRIKQKFNIELKLELDILG